MYLTTNKMYDSVGRIRTYESVIYTSIYAGFTSPTLISLNGTNGNVINIKMFTYFQKYVNDAWGSLSSNIKANRIL